MTPLTTMLIEGVDGGSTYYRTETNSFGREVMEAALNFILFVGLDLVVFSLRESLELFLLVRGLC